MTGRDLPPAMDEFGRRLRDAAQERIDAERLHAARSRRARRGRSIVGALVAVFLPAAAIAGAGVYLSHDGEPLPQDDSLPAQSRPAADPGVIAASAVADPDGGLPWAVKVFTNAQGQECVTVGRLRDGVLGQLRGEDFRPYPREVPGACGSLREDKLIFGVERRRSPATRTVVFGLSSGASNVVLRARTGRFAATPGTLGTFVIVVRGQVPLSGASLRSRIDGATVHKRL